MRAVVIRNNTNEERNWVKVFAPLEEFAVPSDSPGLVVKYAHSGALLSAITSGEASIGNGDTFLGPVTDQVKWLLGAVAPQVNSTQELICTWDQLKRFYDSNSPSSYMSYVDMDDYYYIWVTYREQTLYLPSLSKSDASVFEAAYKSKCNINEAKEVRITTNRFGRRLHRRYISFTTASQGTFCNHNYLLQDQGDVSYKMLDENMQLTTVNADAETTLIDFEPPWCYEIASGAIHIPSELAGNDDDYWEFHTVGVPDVPESMGGCIAFIQNPHLMWSKGGVLSVDSTLNPANMRHNSTYHTNKIRFIVHHPKGAQSKFQVVLGMFRCVSEAGTCVQHTKGVR